MKIGVFSDTHGKISNIKLISEKFDYILHLGDYAEDAKKIADYFSCPYTCVKGNCDLYCSDYPAQTVVSFDGVRILLTHGHKQNTELSLGLLGEESCCNAVLFGHSHTPCLSAYGKILLVNPGSLSEPRYCSRPGYSILLIQNGDLNVKMCTL